MADLIGQAEGVAGKLTSSGNISGIDFGVSNYSFASVGGTCVITMDFITGTIDVLNGMSMTGSSTVLVESPVISVTVPAATTLYYIVTGRKVS